MIHPCFNTVPLLDNPGNPGESNRRRAFEKVLKLDPERFFRQLASSSVSWDEKPETVFSSSLPFFLLLFFLHPPSFRLCVSLFDGLVFALCFPLSLHSAVQRRHGPEAGRQKRERHAGGVRAQGEITANRQFCIVFCFAGKHSERL